MILPVPRVSSLVMMVLAMASGVAAAEPAIIVKARAFLGRDDALDAVRSVHFVGTVVATDPAEPAKETRSAIDIIAQRPDQQRVMATSEKLIETTAVDGYEGWQRTQDATNPANQRLVVFRPDAVKRQSAQAWENLSFYWGIERRGGRIEDLGPESVDGIACQKIAFIYAPNIVFNRYFEIATGRLIQTVTEDGSLSKEDGERIVSGVRFPTRIQMTMKGPTGRKQNIVVEFITITVNETFPDSVFQMPAPGSE